MHRNDRFFKTNSRLKNYFKDILTLDKKLMPSMYLLYITYLNGKQNIFLTKIVWFVEMSIKMQSNTGIYFCMYMHN